MRPAPLLAALVLAGCVSAPLTGSAPFGGPDVPPGNYAKGGEHSEVLAPGALGELPFEVTSIPSAIDGAPIQIGLVRPDTMERVPIVAVSSPYFLDLRQVEPRASHPNYPPQFPALLLDEVLPRGYAIALLPARGTGGSGGCYAWWSPEERADVAQATGWLAEQPWTTGAIGFVGLSMDGAGAWIAAGSGDAHVRTIVPIASETSLREFFYRNGTPMAGNAALGVPAFWLAYGAAPATTPVSHGREPALAVRPCPEVAEAFAAGASETDVQAFLASRDLRPAVEERYRGSVFLVHGLQDPLAQPHLVAPWTDSLRSRGLVVKQLLGQWGHDLPDDPLASNPTVRWDFAEALVRWLDRFLKDDTGVDVGPAVQVADDDGAWRREAAWPPGDASWSDLALAEGGLLVEGEGARGSVFLEPDPARAVIPLQGRQAGCERCVLFRSEPFAEGLRVAGLPQLPLTVTPMGAGGHVTALLYEATPDGDLHLVGKAQMDLRYADGGSTPRSVTPGQPLLARMELEPLELAIGPGARLVLALTQGGYGGTSLENASGALPTFGGYYRGSTAPAPVRVELGGGQSLLRLPIIVRGPETLFEAP